MKMGHLAALARTATGDTACQHSSNAGEVSGTTLSHTCGCCVELTLAHCEQSERRTMAALPVDHFSDLNTLFTYAPADPSLWSPLLVSLEQAKSQLQRLLNFPGPSPAEKSALEAGPLLFWPRLDH